MTALPAVAVAVAVAAVVAPSAGCSLLVDTDVGVRSDAGVDAPSCGTIGRLQDEFSGDALSPRWVVSHQGSHIAMPVVTGGALRMAYGAGVSADGDEWSEVVSHFAHDLRTGSVTVRVDGVHDTWKSNLELSGAWPDGRLVGIGTDGDFLVAWTDDAGDAVAFESDPYQPTTHAYWRIREAAGSLEFETAGEDRQFAPFAHLADPPFALDSVFVALQVVSGGASADEGFIEFDHLNQDAEVTPACPVAALADPFTGDRPGPLWLDRGSGCSYTTAEGLVATAEGAGWCELASARAYSIADGGTLAVEIVDFPAPSGKLELHLVDPEGDRVWLRQEANILRAELDLDDSTADDYDVANDLAGQWWRLRESGGDLVVETSDDGVDYDPRTTFQPAGGIDFTEVRAILVLFPDVDPASFEIAGVNQAP